ncbi:antitoxin Xre/MbcA/ParS toxin-binding domain-containing protein [Pseudomonas cremoricolorata]|uniref:antitoxin Xre/MbcA/ParS toxin-binding domain-containing protein n=1 Tax=Pseudomonas cremoricolorata TaxID=157783 RepID=UPI0009DCBAC0|nr:antitoxin Xre/MbcA/ParS toxin-binding domain-containing protein [Pseudomonas cremoricolorata]
MITSQSSKSIPVNEVQTPIGCLTKIPIGQLSPSDVVSLVLCGFALHDALVMISLSNLYSRPQVSEKIVGATRRSIRRQLNKNHLVRLSAYQSAVAFQYAKILERASDVFGKQTTAEDWLSRPCRYLEGLTPIDLIDNAIGFQVVKDYLDRVEFGIYQ